MTVHTHGSHNGKAPDHDSVTDLPRCFAPPVPETVRFADFLRDWPDELVFIAETPEGADALRDFDLLALARPEGGDWTLEALKPLFDREVAIVQTDPYGYAGQWCTRDRKALESTVRRVGVFTPIDFTLGENAPANLAAYVALKRRLALGSATVAQEALACLEDTMPRVAPPDPAADWPPLRLGERPSVELFPVEVFPPPVAGFVNSVSESIGCPVDLVGLPVLVAVGAAIGQSASLLLKPGYFASASLYGMNVGDPSSGKSPAMEAVVHPLWEIDRELHESYRERKAAFDEAMEDHAKAPKEAKPPKPTPPTIESAVLDDTTVEAVARHLELNPRGLLIARDEGSAWVASIGQYKNGKGSDRQFWLSALFGKTVRVDRKGNLDLEPIRIPHPFLSVIGNLPPSMLPALREQHGRADGFVERILFAFPDPCPKTHWNERGVSEESAREWEEIIRRLRARPMVSSEDTDHPLGITFTSEAKAAWVAWYNAHVDEVNDPGFDTGELAVEGKLADFAGRLVLILHVLDFVADPTRGEAEPIPPVARKAVEGAIRLWSYFRSHHRRVRWVLIGGIGNHDERSIVEWIKRTERVRFSESDLASNLRRFTNDPEAIGRALLWLEDRGVIRSVPEPDRLPGTRGRKPSPTWDVHPHLAAPENSRNSRNSRNSDQDGEFPEYLELPGAGGDNRP